MAASNKRSDSSRKLRDELNASQINNHVPAVESSVAISKYFRHSKHLYQVALTSHNQGEYSYAYIQLKIFLKFAVELGKHAAYHQPQHQAARAWQKKATDYALGMLEAVVARMDAIEDAKLIAEEEALIDEFDGPVVPPAAASTPASVQVPVPPPAAAVAPSIMRPTIHPPDDEFMKALSILKIDDAPPADISASVLQQQSGVPSAPPLFLPQQQQHSAVVSQDHLEDAYDDRRVLALTRAAIASGAVPTPHPHVQDLSLSFAVPAQCVMRYQKHDFFVSFESFMTYLPPDLQISRSVVETNRCFFIHLGVATGFHPYLLQGFFRWAAGKMLQELEKDDMRVELLQSVMQYAGFVDANVLCMLWPCEFSEMRLRVCFLCGSVNRPMVVAFTPEDANSLGDDGSGYLDITMHCDGQHFVFLNPIGMHHAPGCGLLHGGTIVGRSGSTGPIEDLLRHARASGLVVQEHKVRATPAAPASSSFSSSSSSWQAVLGGAGGGAGAGLGIRDFLASVA